jgi:hypothetical protein
MLPTDWKSRQVEQEYQINTNEDEFMSEKVF